MDQDTTQSTFNQVLKQFPYDEFLRFITDFGVDKYIRKLFVIKLLYILIIAQISKIESLRELAGKVKNDLALQKIVKLDSISASQLSRRLRDIKSTFWADTFIAVSKATLVKTAAFAYREPKENRIHIIDSSTISLCLTKFRWADFRKTKSGIKLHQRLQIQNGGSYPDKAILTPAKVSDKSQLDELVTTDPDALNVFDRGYVDYKKWDEYCNAGIRFVTRLKEGALVDVIEQHPIAGTNMTESTVTLGNPKTTGMKYQLRLIQTRDGEGNPIIILTNDFSMDVFEISEIYRLRWQVELFFKWLKQHLRVKRFFGTSDSAVYGQIWIALITYCLLMTTRLTLPVKKTLLETMRLVADHLYSSYSVLIEILKKPPARTSRGRRKYGHSESFNLLIKQIEVDGTEFLNTVDVELNYL
jgi:hypothetical protein